MVESIALIITNFCNMNCKFCLRDKNFSSLDLNLAKKIIKQIKLLRYSRIGISGGEPYLNNNFNEIIKEIVKKDLTFTIVSNGLHYEKYKPLLKYKNHFVGISFSLDAGHEEIHDRLRVPGSFKKVIEAIKFFVKNKIPVRTQICLNKINKNEIESFVNLSEKLGVSRCNFLGVIPNNKNEEFILNDKEKEDCVRLINRLKQKTLLNLHIMSSLCAGNSINFCQGLELFDLAINQKGQLVFCTDTVGDGAVLGDLRKESLKKLIEKGKKVSMFLKQKRKEHYEKGEFFEGFNTCIFCNKYLGCYKN